MSYRLCEIFYSIQGEGIQAGKPAVFCRFAGCNLKCTFCDTDWTTMDHPGGGKYNSPVQLVKAMTECWKLLSHSSIKPLIVCSGGEPLLQLDEPLISELHMQGYEVAVETNGTIVPPPGIDWICVSPKVLDSFVVVRGDELKLLYPLLGLQPNDVEHFEFRHFYLQPIDGLDRVQNMQLAIDYCLKHPQWRFSVQMHKLVGIQ